MLALRTYNHLSSAPVNAFLNEWNRMWPTAQTPTQSRSTHHPRLAVREHEDRHEIFAALPGLKKSELTIELTDRTLVLRRLAPSSEAQNEGQKESCPNPLSISKGFEQRFALPEDGDSEKICAHLEAGILTITIPKKAEPTPLSIQISGE